MKFRPMMAAIFATGLILGGVNLAFAHGSGGGSGTQPYGWQGQMGPGMMMNPNMMGPGMMGQGQMGPGMMMNPNMMGPGMMGQGQMGPGMMMNPNMMGPGMMGPGQMGQGQMGQGQMGQSQMQPLREDLTSDDVKHMMEHQLAWRGNPNIKLGKVEEKDDDTIIAEIVTKDGSLLQRLEVNRHTGWMQPAQ